MDVQHRVPLSVLDLAIVSEGATSADALADTTLLAQRAEAFGYTRFWVAEHHNMPSIASTTPAVLIAHLAAATCDHPGWLGRGDAAQPPIAGCRRAVRHA